ncbi:uncharacterized protein LOC133181079 [Saccostrea echinata]|uniref:uncharacterized protein LOC133181079 n=1 Tax=Saccostrea echinata TaxID=191078 RepID=UPI002A834396|nr:uncharacterized protein LOC133181079 [Saccostrea echinata]
MGKLKKQRKGKKFNYDKNRRKEWKKSKKLPSIECAQIKKAWDPKKSMRRNLEEMGISADPNQTIKIPKTKDFLMDEENDQESEMREKKVHKKQPKEHVVQELEEEANVPLEKTLRLSSEETKYCIYMMEKYGEDYKAMARDRRNYYQDTPKQIKRKIKAFMNIPEQYNAYLATKASSSGCSSFIHAHVEEITLNRHGLNEPGAPENKPDNCTSELELCLSEPSHKNLLPSINSGVVQSSGESGPVPSTPPCKRLIEMPKIPRRVTRTYRAKRRNGHYLTPTFGGTPVKNPNINSVYSRNEVPFHKVRRKLHFGRKPPTDRHLISEIAADKEPSSSDVSVKKEGIETAKEDGNREVTMATEEDEPLAVPLVKGNKNKTARELKNLSDISDMLPNRLRSSTKFCSESHMQDFTFHGLRA